MPTAEISLTNYKEALANVIDKINAGDYAAGFKYYAIAQAQHAGLPKKMGGDSDYTERVESLESLKTALETAQAAATASTPGTRVAVMRTGFVGSNT